MAEVAAAGAGGQDQVVVGITPIVEDHLLGRGVDLLHFPQQDLEVGSLAQ
jgi:hypothetical protein